MTIHFFNAPRREATAEDRFLNYCQDSHAVAAFRLQENEDFDEETYIHIFPRDGLDDYDIFHVKGGASVISEKRAADLDYVTRLCLYLVYHAGQHIDNIRDSALERRLTKLIDEYEEWQKIPYAAE